MKYDVLNIAHMRELVNKIKEAGYEDELNWSRSIEECADGYQFFRETMWVILNSGMKEQIARIIQDRILTAIDMDIDISEAFGHKGKVAAIKFVIENNKRLFLDYLLAEDKLVFLQTIPFIGKITVYHLAKNLGHDCVKPDRHLVRIADKYNLTPLELCQKIQGITGDKLAAIDTIIWRACNLGILAA